MSRWGNEWVALSTPSTTVKEHCLVQVLSIADAALQFDTSQRFRQLWLYLRWDSVCEGVDIKPSICEFKKKVLNEWISVPLLLSLSFCSSSPALLFVAPACDVVSPSLRKRPRVSSWIRVRTAVSEPLPSAGLGCVSYHSPWINEKQDN